MWVQISAGLAPIEACRLVFLFWQTIERECVEKRMKLEVINAVTAAERGTYKSVLLKLTGPKAKDYANAIEGTMQWICSSEYRPNHKRKNWFIEVEVYDEEAPVIFTTDEIRIETMRCSGNGGQNVNKLETGVRITHLHTGVVVTAQEERSQLQNKKLALQRMRKKLDELMSDKQLAFAQRCWQKHQCIKRGEPIRTFKGKGFIEIKYK